MTRRRVYVALCGRGSLSTMQPAEIGRHEPQAGRVDGGLDVRRVLDAEPHLHR